MSQQESATAQGRERSARWVAADIPDQSGRVALITGGNSGIGYTAAVYLASRGADVVLAGRDAAKTTAAAKRVANEAAGARPARPRAAADGAVDSSGGELHVGVITLDLASLESVRTAASEIRERYPRLDLLINNAGVMMPPHSQTADGFELQLGTNHLGHFALTGLVLPSLIGVPGSRIVTVSSNGHKLGRIRFDDLNFENRYRRSTSYGQSKLANLLFTYELQRRLAAAGAPTLSLAAHPGTSNTALTRHLPVWMQVASRLSPSQDARMGALPTLRAATDPAAVGGEYYGPAGFGELTGPPKLVKSSARSHDAEVQRRLWAVSEELTGVSYLD
jgi:NAD(P)-dependent dehydrogenase (short-subunit alcohol dehydrogenase family)